MNFRRIFKLGKEGVADAPRQPSGDSSSEKKEMCHEIDLRVLAKNLAALATHLWKATGRVKDPDSGEIKEPFRRLYRNLEGIAEALDDIGIQVKDRTGERYDYGFPEKVIVAEPAEGTTHETVKETVKPTVFWHTQLIQVGEITILTPTSDSADSKDEKKHD